MEYLGGGSVLDMVISLPTSCTGSVMRLQLGKGPLEEVYIAIIMRETLKVTVDSVSLANHSVIAGY
jgi:hypothetical protein